MSRGEFERAKRQLKEAKKLFDRAIRLAKKVEDTKVIATARAYLTEMRREEGWEKLGRTPD